jgi:ADP-dependent phosphofructokinase/glucokinase
LNDLKSALAYSFKKGSANELKIENKKLYNELLELKVSKKRLGGQMGIVANTLATLGVHKIIVFTNLLSKEQTSMFDKRVLFPIIKNNKIILKPVHECGRESDETRINIIIEYKKGTKVKLKDKTLIIPRSNRFIISSPVTKSPPLIPKNLLRADLWNKFDKAFISGYHHIKKNEATKVFKEWKEQLRIIKRLNPDLNIHLEYVDLHKDWLNKALFKVLKLIDSFGLNEVEAMNIMKYLGKKGYDKISPENLVKAGEELIKSFKFKRVNIHTLKYLIELTTYSIDEEKVIHANLFGVRVVNSKGVSGEKFMKALKSIHKYAPSPVGIKAASKKYNTKNNLIIVPNFKTHTVPVKYTVGLGDTVSSSVFFSLD